MLATFCFLGSKWTDGEANTFDVLSMFYGGGEEFGENFRLDPSILAVEKESQATKQFSDISGKSRTKAINFSFLMEGFHYRWYLYKILQYREMKGKKIKEY